MSKELDKIKISFLLNKQEVKINGEPTYKVNKEGDVILSFDIVNGSKLDKAELIIKEVHYIKEEKE